ncbi:MAG: porphobilinogen synthase [Candidatus Omnitrophica bacterium]|nr:porphobilinogen synthase [Candidatus Omnitrophota bacterium]
MNPLPIRPRRNRRTAAIRALLRETALQPCDLVLPLFVQEGKQRSTPIPSLPGCARLSPDLILRAATEAFELGVLAVALFPVLAESLKDKTATESKNPKGLLPRTIKLLKQDLPELSVIGDVAMDPYSIDGHDGLVEDNKILNDPTLEILGDMALNQAAAGADWLAPSDMMDGRVGHLRRVLDENGFEEVGILSYAAKYASSLYGPFREALDSAPRTGDKKTYQMDPANVREALREVRLDVAEGADIVMIKPALPYLDVIARVKAVVDVPVAAYHVSGEYSMVMAAAEKGWLDGDAVMAEMLLAIKRAGADLIFSYYATEMARSLSTSEQR